MVRKIFGTDGIRGKANKFPMTAELALKLGMATGHYFVRGDHRHKVIIGKDTRLSGYMIEPALTAGFISMGMDVILVGPLPTPAIAMLTKSMRADIGVMISASHNLYEDNGIKIFNPEGQKLSDETEAEIESLMEQDLTTKLIESKDLGRATRLENARGRYIEFVKNSFAKNLTLDGLKIVLDCANGAGYYVAPIILRELGAEVVVMANSPDGFNINKSCGSTHTQKMQGLVAAEKADLGISLDGDADRLAMCDENGELVDGDQLLAVITKSWKESGRLKGNGVIATVMSNLGLEKYINDLGLQLHRTQVGDRYVAEEMRRTGINIGGEQSGHIIMSDYTTTGDALVAALQVLSVIAATKQRASAALAVFGALPQILKNYRFSAFQDPQKLLDKASGAIAEAEQKLNGAGRVLIRKSGTEPLIRVMLEGKDKQVIEQLADNIITAFGS